MWITTPSVSGRGCVNPSPRLPICELGDAALVSNLQQGPGYLIEVFLQLTSCEIKGGPVLAGTTMVGVLAPEGIEIVIGD